MRKILFSRRVFDNSGKLWYKEHEKVDIAINLYASGRREEPEGLNLFPGMEAGLAPLFYFLHREVRQGMNVNADYGFRRWPMMEEPARAVTDTMQRAMRFLDTCKEYVLIQEGMPMTALCIHQQAHTYGELWDRFGAVLHQRHMIQRFPATPELDEAPDLTRAFEIILDCMERIITALGDFILAADGARLYPLGREAENLQMAVSQDMTRWLEAARLWEDAKGNKVSYEKWMKEFFSSSEDTAE